MITTLAEGADVQPAALVTVKLYVPGASADMIELDPFPVTADGLIVQFPVGSPLSTTLPVATAQVGWVMTPIRGVAGLAGCGLMMMFAVGADVHVASLVTVKLYVPATNPVIVFVVPVPVIAPGLMVQLPDGRPFRITLPVELLQVVCVIAPTIGAGGDSTEALITTADDGSDEHPDPIVTV
jgi:hypothetical protein